MSLSRREFVQLAGAGALLKSRLLSATQSTLTAATAAQDFPPHSKVALVQGDIRRTNVYQALVGIDDQILPDLKRKKYVVIKPNCVSSRNQLASAHVDALAGILDYLEPRFHGPVIIAESSADDTLEAFENFKYPELAKERSAQKVSLVDLNREGKFETIPLIDFDLHVTPVRLAARLLAPDAYVISSAMLKAHRRHHDVDQKHGAGRAFDQRSRRAALERQTKIPCWNSPDSLQHVAYRAKAPTELGSSCDRRL